MMFNCEKCKKIFAADKLPRRGEICFACHVKDVRLGFTWGQDDWHNQPSVKFREKQQVEEAKAAGLTIERV